MSARSRRAASAALFAQAQAFDVHEAEELAKLPGFFSSDLNRGERRILRDEARRLATAPAKFKRSRRPPRLRIGAGTEEIIEAFAVLRLRVDELSERLDKTYESAERDEAELETLLHVIEAAAHDTMDWTPDEQGEGQEDDSTDDDDADISFAESLTRGGGFCRVSTMGERGETIRRTPLRASKSQAIALGVSPTTGESHEWWKGEEREGEKAGPRRRSKLARCAHPA